MAFSISQNFSKTTAHEMTTVVFLLSENVKPRLSSVVMWCRRSGYVRIREMWCIGTFCLRVGSERGHPECYQDGVRQSTRGLLH